MRSVHKLLLRAAAVSLALSGAALCAETSCSFIGSSTDCNDACEILDNCGALHAGDCGLYCATLVTAAATAGCDDQFAAQNTCATNNGACDSPSGSACAPQVAAFASCMESYCATNPTAGGCSDFPSDGDGGTGGGGTGGGSTGTDGG